MLRAMATCAGVSSDSDLEAISCGTLPSQKHFDVHTVKRALDVSDSDYEDDASTTDSVEPMLSPSGSVGDSESETVMLVFQLPNVIIVASSIIVPYSRILQVVIHITDHSGFEIWMKFRVLYLIQHLVIALVHVARKTHHQMILTQGVILVIPK